MIQNYLLNKDLQVWTATFFHRMYIFFFNLKKYYWKSKIHFFNNDMWNLKIFKNISVEKKTLSTVLGFEPRPFNCRSTVSRKAWARILAQSNASFFHRKISNFLKFEFICIICDTVKYIFSLVNQWKGKSLIQSIKIWLIQI